MWFHLSAPILYAGFEKKPTLTLPAVNVKKMKKIILKRFVVNVFIRNIQFNRNSR